MQTPLKIKYFAGETFFLSTLIAGNDFNFLICNLRRILSPNNVQIGYQSILLSLLAPTRAIFRKSRSFVKNIAKRNWPNNITLQIVAKNDCEVKHRNNMYVVFITS